MNYASVATRTAAAVTLVVAPGGISAKTLTNTMSVRMDVETSCKLFTNPLSFGAANILSGQIDATTTIRLQCGPSIAYSVAIDNGQNYNGQRRMSNGTGGFFSYVTYQIYRNAARTQVWGSTAGTMVTGTTPANGQVTLTAYGRVPASIVLPSEYVDTVTVTVNF